MYSGFKRKCVLNINRDNSLLFTVNIWIKKRLRDKYPKYFSRNNKSLLFNQHIFETSPDYNWGHFNL